MQVADGVFVSLKHVRVVEQIAPMLLIGADLLCGGKVGDWNFAGIRVRTPEAGITEGWLQFEREGEVRCTRLVHCPAAGGDRFTSSMVNAVNGGQLAHVHEWGSREGPQWV